VTESLNVSYRAALLERLRVSAARGPEYAEALKLASRDAAYRTRAMQLRRGWRRMQTALDRADTVSLGEMRALCAGADDLVGSSYDLKYAYLIARLLDGK
jgi:hypothetical protein